MKRKLLSLQMICVLLSVNLIPVIGHADELTQSESSTIEEGTTELRELLQLKKLHRLLIHLLLRQKLVQLSQLIPAQNPQKKYNLLQTAMRKYQ